MKTYLVEIIFQDHKEYAGLFVGCRKEEENGGDSEDEEKNNFNLISSKSQLKHFMTHVPDKIDINIKSEVGGSILQLKKVSFHQSIGRYLLVAKLLYKQ